MAPGINSRVARTILEKTVNLKKGETITVETWNTGLEFALEVVRQARRKGALPVLLFEDEKSFVDGVRKMPKESQGLMGKHEYGLLAGSDVYVFIPGPPLGSTYSRLSRSEYADSKKYNSSWYKAAKKAKLRGARLTFGYVGKDLAKLLGKSVEEVVHGRLDGALTDYNKISKFGRAISSKLVDGSQVVVSTGSSELELTLKGDSEVQDGIVDRDDIDHGVNMSYIPPGYVEKAVSKSSARGSVNFTNSFTRFGVIADARLNFKRGRATSWSSENSEKLVDQILGGTKERDRVVNYLTIGLNPRLSYGLGADAFVEGSTCIYGFGFIGVCRNASVTVDGRTIVDEGKVSV